jgi:hypothetical protein
MEVGVGPVGFDVEQHALIWAMWRRGDAIREMERTLGETLPRIRRYLRESGGGKKKRASCSAFETTTPPLCRVGW